MEVNTDKGDNEETGYDSHQWVMKKLAEAQGADEDMRENAREAALFVYKRDGQWEPYWWNKARGKPRYTFDITNPVVDQIAASMNKQEYEIRVHPGGGESSMDIAETYEGLIRHIQDISSADEVYSRSGKSMLIKGQDGIEIAQKYLDADSFDQDLIIKVVPNWIDSVWFGPHTEPDGSDAKMAWKMVSMSKEEYKSKYPNASDSAGVPNDRQSEGFDHKQETIDVGAFYCLKEEKRVIVMMSNGVVYEDNAEFRALTDELMQMGFTESGRRERKVEVLYIRHFNNDGWLAKAERTVFRNWIPLVPMYANFDYQESKILYHGCVEKLIDPQRVFNYTLSREIEEGALSPRSKYWMSEKQAEGHEDELNTLNTNSDPVQLFNPDPELPGPPMQSGGAQINPGLRTISEAMQNIVGMSAGMFAANMGDTPGFMQSGKAIEALQSKGDDGNNKYIMAREVAMRQAGRILVNTIPRVYLPGRQVRLLQQDGSGEQATIGQMIVDQQTGEPVVLSELERGSYDVTCSSGPSFQSRQSHTVTALTEVGALDPSIIASSADILLGNIDSPGMDKVAKRKRRELLMAGAIPPDEFTPEEQQEMAQMQQQPQQPDAMTIAAQAEQLKAESDMIDAQTKQAQVQADIQQKQAQIEVDRMNAETARIKVQVEAHKAGADSALTLSKTEAQDLDNAVKASGIEGIVEQLTGASNG